MQKIDTTRADHFEPHESAEFSVSILFHAAMASFCLSRDIDVPSESAETA